jgi:hypothetical protein
VTTSNDNRRAARAAVSLMGTVQLDGGEQHPIVVLNLSATGAMIQAHEAPGAEAVYRLEFTVHRRRYSLPFKPVSWVQQGESFGWRGPFGDLTPEESKALDRAVNAAIGVSVGSMRPWAEISKEAAQGDAKVVVGETAAGHPIEVAAADALAMGSEGVELYVRLMTELETM